MDIEQQSMPIKSILQGCQFREVQEHTQGIHKKTMLIHPNLENEESAYKYILDKFIRYDLLISVERYNKGRHILITTKIGRFYCIFKRELFHSFKAQFPEFKFTNPMAITGDYEGESINKEFLDIAINKDAILLFIYPDRAIYKAYPAQLKRIAETFKLIREQDKAYSYKTKGFSNSEILMKEITYSLPFVPALFKRIDLEEMIGWKRDGS